MPWTHKLPDLKNDPLYLAPKVDELTSELAQISYNVKSNGTDDTTAIQSVINSMSDGGKLLLPDGLYIVSSDIIVNKNISIVGGNKTVIKIKNGSRIRYIFKFDTLASVRVNGITFDMNVQNTPAYLSADYLNGSYNESIYCANITERIEIRHCKFVNLYNESISLYNVSAPVIRIKDNHFSSPVQSQNLRLTHIQLQTIVTLGNIIIENNVFDNAQPPSAQYGVNAIFAEGVKMQTIIRKNKFNWCGRDNTGEHRLLPIDLYNNCNFFTISDNIFDNCLYGFTRIEASQDVTVKDNKFYYTSGTMLPEPAIWIVSNVVGQQEKNIKITNNEFYAKANSQIQVLVAVYHEHWDKPPTNIEIKDNSVFGYVINFVKASASVDGLKIKNNRCYSYDGKASEKLFDLVRSTVTVSNGSEVNSFTKGISIIDNSWEAATGAINADLTSYLGTSEQIIIEGNKLKGVSGMGSGIMAKNTHITIKNNFLSNNPEGIAINGDKKAYILNNIFENMDGAPLYLVNATNYLQDGNYYNGVIVS